MRGTKTWLTNRSRVLRSNSTSAEDLIWSELRGRRLGGLKFVRQYPVGPYFADFVCRENKIIVEIDGGTHGASAEITRDRKRSAYLIAEGFRIFRADNQEVYDNIDGVLDTLLALVRGEVECADIVPAAAPHPNPLPVKCSDGERE
jgi:very-short-patch-repair endonuclease